LIRSNKDSILTKVIVWDTKLHSNAKSYTASASIYNNDELINESTYKFSYGFVTLPRFKVIDLSATSSGARALANKPAIILADEPTGEVDTKTRDLIINILRRLSDHGQTVIIVTHDPWVAERTDRTIKLVDGKLEDLLK